MDKKIVRHYLFTGYLMAKCRLRNFTTSWQTISHTSLEGLLFAIIAENLKNWMHFRKGNFHLIGFYWKPVLYLKSIHFWNNVWAIFSLSKQGICILKLIDRFCEKYLVFIKNNLHKHCFKNKWILAMQVVFLSYPIEKFCSTKT